MRISWRFPPISRSRPIWRGNSPTIESACAERGIDFLPLELDDAAQGLAGRDPASTLVWTLTDGIAYFRGGAAPALARLNGLPTIGADDSLFALCQDKFRSGAVLAALGMPVPPAGLARDGVWLVEPPASPLGWFVKPNRLGAKIGIWPDSRCAVARRGAGPQPPRACCLSRRCRGAALCAGPQCARQLPGRASRGRAGSAWHLLRRLGRAISRPWTTSMALYGESGAAAMAQGRYVEPELVPVADSAARGRRRGSGRLPRS